MISDAVWAPFKWLAEAGQTTRLVPDYVDTWTQGHIACTGWWWSIQSKYNNLLITVPQMLEVGKSNVWFGSRDEFSLTLGGISSHQHHQRSMRQHLHQQHSIIQLTSYGKQQMSTCNNNNNNNNNPIYKAPKALAWEALDAGQLWVLQIIRQWSGLL